MPLTKVFCIGRLKLISFYILPVTELKVLPLLPNEFLSLQSSTLGWLHDYATKKLFTPINLFKIAKSCTIPHYLVKVTLPCINTNF